MMLPERRQGADLRQTVVNVENIKHSIEIQEKEAIGKTIIHREEGDDGLGDHDFQGHRRNEAELAQHVDFALHDNGFLRGDRVGAFGSLRDNDSWERLWHEAHNEHKSSPDYGTIAPISFKI